jgi:hypothetical protein
MGRPDADPHLVIMAVVGLRRVSGLSAPTMPRVSPVRLSLTSKYHGSSETMLLITSLSQPYSPVSGVREALGTSSMLTISPLTGLGTEMLLKSSLYVTPSMFLPAGEPKSAILTGPHTQSG